MNELIIVRNNEVFTDSLIIADGTGNEHESIKRLISTYENEFLELGYLPISNREINRKETRGRKEELYELNEPQATFLMTLLRNSPAVVNFKLELVKQFYQMRTLLQGNISQTLDTDLKNYISDTIKQMLEKQGKITKMPESKPIAEEYFTAINEALRSDCWLLPSRKGELITDNCIRGAYDNEFYYLMSDRTYILAYKSLVNNPMPKQAIMAFLLHQGYIKPKTDKWGRVTGAVHNTSMCKDTHQCIWVYRDKVKLITRE